MYGTVEGVASLAKMWTDDGVFRDPVDLTPGTQPTYTEVNKWLTDTSFTFDIALAGYGFITPVTVESAKASIGQFVELLVSDMVHAQNSSGRQYIERAIERQTNGMSSMRSRIDKWIGEYADGLEAVGVPKKPSFSGKSQAIIETV